MPTRYRLQTLEHSFVIGIAVINTHTDISHTYFLHYILNKKLRAAPSRPSHKTVSQKPTPACMTGARSLPRPRHCLHCRGSLRRGRPLPSPDLTGAHPDDSPQGLPEAHVIKKHLTPKFEVQRVVTFDQGSLLGLRSASMSLSENPWRSGMHDGSTKGILSSKISTSLWYAISPVLGIQTFTRGEVA
jgi:hypothetical protein